MKAVIVAALIALVGCGRQPDVSCPAIESLTQRDAAADARAALAKGDHRLLMLGGFVGEVPGVSNADAYPTRIIEGTSDTTTEACSQQRAVAKVYAAKYNETVVQTH